MVSLQTSVASGSSRLLLLFFVITVVVVDVIAVVVGVAVIISNACDENMDVCTSVFVRLSDRECMCVCSWESSIQAAALKGI